MGLVRPLSFHPISHGRLRERRKTLTSHPTPLRWTGSGSLALLVTRAMVISGDRTPRASGQTDRGLGSQQRSLVRRGQRSTMAVRRDAPSWLVGDNPSGAEASSGSPDTCRSTGCGVEKATEIPRSERRAIGVVQIHTKFCSARAAAPCALLARQNFDQKLLLPFVSLTSVVGPLAQPSASLAVGTG